MMLAARGGKRTKKVEFCGGADKDEAIGNRHRWLYSEHYSRRFGRQAIEERA
jgi:hypothetical protein